MDTLAEQIKMLEEKLLHTDMKANPSIMDELLSEGFEEIDGSGKIGSRKTVVDWLTNKSRNDRWILSDFKVSHISPDVVLAVYRAQKTSDSKQNNNATLRSSIWKRHDNCWKMIFHQASKQSE